MPDRVKYGSVIPVWLLGALSAWRKDLISSLNERPTDQATSWDLRPLPPGLPCNPQSSAGGRSAPANPSYTYMRQ
jgi:hypothetical protein